jgi:hypothetical protein
MATIGDLLFFTGWNRPSLDDALSHSFSSQAPEAVAKLQARDFADRSDDEIAAAIADGLKVAPLVLDLAGAKADVQDKAIQVQDHWGGIATVDGLRITKQIPFSGDKELWKLYANSFSMNPPRGDVRQKEVVIGMEVRAEKSDDAIRYIEETIGQIGEYIENQQQPIAAFNASLPSRLIPMIAARRAHLNKADDIRRKLDGA